jgi:Do/DeqQ family serine protease
MNLGSSTLVTALVSLAAFAAGSAFNCNSPRAAAIPDGNASSEATLAPILDRATPAVVSISVSGHVAVDPFFGHFFHSFQPQEFQAAGSGVIVDAQQGFIVTNNHLVQHADQITARTHDGRDLDAELVGTDPQVDLAVLHVKGDNLTSLPIGDSEKMRVGDFVIAIGNPFGLSETATHGIVSALGRSGLHIAPDGGYENYIQTDAAINPGNSGGALINMRGELIGINTAIVGATGGNVGISFAIPTSMMKSTMQQIIDHGEVRRGKLGVMGEDVTADIAHGAGLEGALGVQVSRVLKGSAAAKAGIKNGDIILGIDGSPVRDWDDLRVKVGTHSIGDRVKVQILRDGKKQTLNATLTDPSQTRSGFERA